MHISAKDLLGDWYSQAVKIELNAPEIALRQASVTRLITNESSTFWLDSVRLFYGNLSQEHAIYQQYVTECRSEDPNFPIRNNEHVLRTIAGCAIAQKIEGERSHLNDAICLVLLTTNYQNRFGNYPIIELPDRALMQWLKECGVMRNINQNLSYNPTPVELKTKKIDIPELITNGYGGAETTSVTAAIKKVQGHLTSLQADVQNILSHNGNSLKPILTDINTRFNVLSEETNILWWLFSGFSRDLDKPFDEVGLPAMAILAPKELADLTVILPGLGHIKAHLSKAFRLAAKENFTTDQPIKVIIESIGDKEVWAKSTFTEIPETYRDLLPCLFGIHCYLEFGESWDTVYQKKTNISPKKEVSILNFAEQLYRESLFVRVFKQLD